jgi:hypothetical protein
LIAVLDALVPGAGRFAARARISNEDGAALNDIDDVDAWVAHEAAADSGLFRRLRAAAWDALFSTEAGAHAFGVAPHPKSRRRT